jgi:hypothetical protein
MSQAKEQAMFSTCLETHHLETLRQIAKRLYSENRMHGDEMRDTAQALDAIIRQIEVFKEEL